LGEVLEAQVITLKLPFHNTVRLATTRGAYRYRCEEELVAALPEISGSVLKNRCVIVEWLSPRGGHFLYGLLGGFAEPVGAAFGEVRVAVGERDGPPLEGTLVDALDRVHVGLPKDYAAAILTSAMAAVAKAPLSPSTIRFDEAVYGEVGSSEIVFERLATLVVRLMGMEISGESELLRGTVTEVLLAEW
jgi:hypothetical protein